LATRAINLTVPRKLKSRTCKPRMALIIRPIKVGRIATRFTTAKAVSENLNLPRVSYEHLGSLVHYQRRSTYSTMKIRAVIVPKSVKNNGARRQIG
jgi:hypothetical protein